MGWGLRTCWRGVHDVGWKGRRAWSQMVKGSIIDFITTMRVGLDEFVRERAMKSCEMR